MPAPSALAPASLRSLPPTQALVDRPALVRAPINSDRPDVFGSVALKVGSTRLDQRWRKVAAAPVHGAAAAFGKSLSDSDAIEQLEAVNRYVNRRVSFTDDAAQYGRADVWSAASETLQRGRGDCEDYAIAKYQMLRRAGLPDRDLYLVIVKDLVTRSDHAVLVVRAAGRLLVLDNSTDKLLDSDTIRDYRPILTFAAGATWTHGYRQVAEQPVLASNEPVESAPIARAASGQRSRSASLLALSTGLSK